MINPHLAGKRGYRGRVRALVAKIRSFPFRSRSVPSGLITYRAGLVFGLAMSTSYTGLINPGIFQPGLS